MEPMPSTPMKKVRYRSPSREAGYDWMAGAVRVLQKDCASLLSVTADLAKRMTSIEQRLDETGALPVLKLPTFQPAVPYVTANQLDSMLTEKLHGMSDLSSRIELLAKRFDNLEASLGKFHVAGGSKSGASFPERLSMLEEKVCEKICFLELQLSSFKASLDNNYNASGDISSIFQRVAILESREVIPSNIEEQEMFRMNGEIPKRIKLLDDQVTRIFDIVDSLDRGLTALGEDFQRMQISHNRSSFDRW